MKDSKNFTLSNYIFEDLELQNVMVDDLRTNKNENFGFSKNGITLTIDEQEVPHEIFRHRK